ncbi:hypothetical protein C8Q78DRAFT_1017778 [Trametes maxima]|nr:hypothetical protein C8Q78DRAFT_1017778 [Trametes maxima]
MRINTDHGFRRPQSWGALHALESLTPPSPSPSGSLSALATLASLSDIPIFLHTDDDSLPRDLNSTSVKVHPERRQSTFLAPSASTTTVHSTNTFGIPNSPNPRPGGPDVVTPDDASNCTARPPLRHNLTHTPNPAYLSAVRPSRSGGYFSNRFASISDLSHFTISAYMEPWASGDNPDTSPSDAVYPSPGMGPVVSPSGSIIVSPADDYDSVPASPSPFYETSQFPSTDSLASGPSPSLAPPPSRSWSAISSVLFSRLNISPSPSSTSNQTADSHPSPGKHLFGLSLKKTRSPSVHSDLGEQTKRRRSPLGTQPSRSTPVSPISPHFDALPGPLLAPGGVEAWGATSSGPSSGSGHSSRAPPSVHDLPAALSWLNETCIELWIDQEGFRAIRPRFRLASYTAPPSGTLIADALTHGVASFRPLRCHSAVYHHGALDSAPVLRRLTMAGNEERDYISRHASLTIKENGVYAVSGTEWVEDHHPHVHGGSQQLSWRFEYAVDDLRRHDGRRAVANGEKTLVPLSFSCSPGLLEHGKRIKLMHVLKKNITPKLSAKAVTDSPVREKAHTTALGGDSTRKARGSPSHRRTRSTEPPASDIASWHPTNEDEPLKKARPVSVSAAPSPSELGELPYEAGARPETNVGSMTSSRLSAHILTQEELADILSRFPGPVGDRPPVAQPYVGFGALSPPSYYRHRRKPSEMERVDELGVVGG